MRFVVVGTGAVGGVVGGRLHEHGHDVVFVARPAQAAAIRNDGLRIESPETTEVLRGLTIVEELSEIRWTSRDVVLLAIKTQDSCAALSSLASVAPDVPIVCIQNGVENERLASRWFRHVYGVCVLCPSGYVTPGVVQAWCAPLTGFLDLGRYPSGVDELAQSVAGVFRSSSFGSEVRPDVMRWKYAKLLMNLGNAAEALCGVREARRGAVAELARAEALTCFSAAGIEYVSEEEMNERHRSLRFGSIGGGVRVGGSSWQSLKRQTRSIEVDYFNGEIARLGTAFGVATPVNTLLQRLANQVARECKPPGSMTSEELLMKVEEALRAVG
jgi:2-dehydropantoate 2-reductase